MTTTHTRRAALVRRWPTVLGVALGVDALFSEITRETTRSYSELLMVMPLLYLVVAVLHRRSVTWPVFGVLLALFLGLRLQDAVDPVLVLLAAGLAVTIWGAGHGRHREHDVRLQVAGVVVFAAVALAAPAVHPDLGRYLVAAGLFGHGVWDLVHLVKDRTVSRTYAEWCGALDISVAVALVVAPLL